jgi:hypothetical protein
MHRSEEKYGATFCLAVQRNNRNFPQARHCRTRCGQHVSKGQPGQANDGAPEYAHCRSQNLDASAYSGEFSTGALKKSIEAKFNSKAAALERLRRDFGLSRSRMD